MSPGEVGSRIVGHTESAGRNCYEPDIGVSHRMIADCLRFGCERDTVAIWTMKCSRDTCADGRLTWNEKLSGPRSQDLRLWSQELSIASTMGETDLGVETAPERVSLKVVWGWCGEIFGVPLWCCGLVESA